MLALRLVRHQSTYSAAAAASAVATATTTSVADGTSTTTTTTATIAPPLSNFGRNRRFNLLTNSQHKLYNDPLVSRYVPELEQTRIVPSMASFYSRNPYHEEHISKLQNLLNKSATLPFNRKSSTSSWIRFNQYREKAGGTLLKETEYLQLLNILKRLDSIDLELRSDELNSTLSEYIRNKSNINSSLRIKSLDDKGRAIAVGRRKASSAKIYVVEGEGKILINGKSIEQVFPKQQDRLKLLYPLQIVESENKFNIFGLSRGGGTSGQIGSLQLALSKALCIHNPLFKQRLSSAGVLHRDPRTVERKKPGKKKARKMPTWVKR